ncbi:MAG: hypothetical protein WDW38_004558 [Sanguina aurantia]
MQQMLSAAAAAVMLLTSAQPAHAYADQGAGAMSVTNKLLCDTECEAGLVDLETVTTASGLQYKDIVVGRGPNPPVGFQAVVNYVAITPSGKIFDSSLDKGVPYDIRVGANQVIPGLDEGLLSMKPGGLRRLFIPGPLSFPKGLKAAPGRPAVPPMSPMVFDVKLEYIPGMEVDEEEYPLEITNAELLVPQDVASKE